MDESGISLGFDLDDSNLIESFIDSDDLLRISPSDMDSLNFYEIRSRPAPVSASPSFKTEVVKSRTQFKQTLMRDQLQKEKEKRKLEETNSSNAINSSKVQVPINIQNVDLPQHVLHVKTGLQNPTKYHIIQKQKHQVLQYLSSSQQDEDMFPIKRTETVSAPSGHIRGQDASRLTASYTVLAPAPSPGVMSVASGGTSDAEEVIEGILSYEESSVTSETDSRRRSLYGSNASLEKSRDTSSCPTASHGVKQEYFSSYDDSSKDRMKKDTHNMIERRRRYNINDRIKELGDLLPQKNELHYDLLREGRTNKGTILKSSVDYIKMLKGDISKMKVMKDENRQLQADNRKLLLRIQQLEIQAKSKGVALQEPTWKVKEPAAIINQYIRPGPRPNFLLMPDVVSEAAYVQYDESIEDVTLPDPIIAAPNVPSTPKSLPENMDYD